MKNVDRIPIYKLILDNDDIASVINIMCSGNISRGKLPSFFEKKLSKYLGVSHCILFSSGTAALHAALGVLDLPFGSEVIVPSFTFVATAFAPIYNDLNVIFADINEKTLTIDPIDVEKKITSKTKAIIVVDYAGQPADLNRLKKIAKRNKCYLIEDAAHSLGASYKGEKIGTIADLTIFSFFATKNITSGEGGAVVTNNSKLARRLQLFKSHGIFYSSKKRISGLYDVIQLGFNYHLSNLNVALLISQLSKLNKKNKEREKIARYFNNFLNKDFLGKHIKVPIINTGRVFHLYTVILDMSFFKVTRDYLIERIVEEGVSVGVYYKPVHLFKYFVERYKTKTGDLPFTEKISSNLITLPLYPDMTKKEVSKTMSGFIKVLKKFKK